jgi:ubiquinone biosynthesis protein COQ4
MNKTSGLAKKKTPIQWRKAISAMRRLIANPEATEEVFIIIESLAGNALEKGFRRFEATATGQRILAEKRSLLDSLRDREMLSEQPKSSLAANYLNFVIKEEISADGLVEPSEDMRSTRNLDEDLLLFANRQRDMHDLWHTLTNYGRDELGEVCLLAFTCAQSPNRGIAFITLVGVYQMIKRYGWDVPGTVLGAYRDGKKAQWLPAQDWEALLQQPIGEVRSRLNIRPPQRYQHIRRFELMADA